MTQLKFVPVGQWLHQRQARVLNSAYTAAQEIQALERQYFEGNPVAEHSNVGKTVYDYLKSLCDRKLLKIRNNLTQFRINSFLLGHPPKTSSSPLQDINQEQIEATDGSESFSDDVLEKLNFIESVISRYRDLDLQTNQADLQAAVGTPAPAKKKVRSAPDIAAERQGENAAALISDPALLEVEMTAIELSRPGLLGSFSMSKEQNAVYEQRVVQELRQLRQQSRRALRWLAILLLVPILVAVLVKNLVFGPVLGNYSNTNPSAVQLSEEIREEFAANLTEFKEQLEIRERLKLTPELKPQAKQEQIAEKAADLWQEARNEELEGLKNVLSDGVATLAFVGLVYFNRRRLTVIRSFANRTFLSLSDPVKIFCLILITDIFVGFHSVEGWDALLTGLTHHFGLPERPDAIKVFIATVPVIMDSCIKFWIFSYLT
ncbi:MAG: hypothetical protein WA902_05160, partial [Thermosynechococcaceae cyanobacterium]